MKPSLPLPHTFQSHHPYQFTFSLYLLLKTHLPVHIPNPPTSFCSFFKYPSPCSHTKTHPTPSSSSSSSSSSSLMGNYISCTLSNPSSSLQSNSTKVIFPDGEIKQLHQLTNAAELMLETPNHFLVNSQSLHIGQRFSALSADEDLEIGNVYVLFPMRRLNSVITPGDMGRLLMTADSSVRRATAEGASPEVKSWGERDTERLNLEEIEDDGVSEVKVRLAMCRSRRPLLETIPEETVCSR